MCERCHQSNHMQNVLTRPKPDNTVRYMQAVCELYFAREARQAPTWLHHYDIWDYYKQMI